MDTNFDIQKKKKDNPAVIGIAWRTVRDSVSFKYFCKGIKEAGADYVLLDQVISPYFSYGDSRQDEADETGKLPDEKNRRHRHDINERRSGDRDRRDESYSRLLEGVAGTGALTEEAGVLLRQHSWKGSNAEKVLKNVDAVLFTGGQDVSPSLYRDQKPWHAIREERDYFAERDISDYLLMSCCLDLDIPMLGACRGMQMLSVVSGAEMIQDIPTYFRDQGKEYGYQHRPYYDKDTPPASLDFVRNDVHVEKGTLLHALVGTDTLTGCPCWHHQAAENVDRTKLTVSGYTTSGGVKMIEAVERTDQTFALGLQFHPEAPVWKKFKNAANRDVYLKYETAMLLFKGLAKAGLMRRKERQSQETSVKKPFVFAISGYKNSGKTTLITRLIPELKKRGLKVATIKHDGHDFEPDVPGTDSFRHRKAGAFGTAVFSDRHLMVIKELTSGQRPDERLLFRAFSEADIIIIEGLKDSPYPKYFCEYPDKPLMKADELADRIIGLMNSEFHGDQNRKDISDG